MQTDHPFAAETRPLIAAELRRETHEGLGRSRRHETWHHTKMHCHVWVQLTEQDMHDTHLSSLCGGDPLAGRPADAAALDSFDPEPVRPARLRQIAPDCARLRQIVGSRAATCEGRRLHRAAAPAPCRPTAASSRAEHAARARGKRARRQRDISGVIGSLLCDELQPIDQPSLHPVTQGLNLDNRCIWVNMVTKERSQEFPAFLAAERGHVYSRKPWWGRRREMVHAFYKASRIRPEMLGELPRVLVMQENSRAARGAALMRRPRPMIEVIYTAEIMGIDPLEQGPLVFLAEEALHLALPLGWTKVTDRLLGTTPLCNVQKQPLPTPRSTSC